MSTLKLFFLINAQVLKSSAARGHTIKKEVTKKENRLIFIKSRFRRHVTVSINQIWISETLRITLGCYEHLFSSIIIHYKHKRIRNILIRCANIGWMIFFRSDPSAHPATNCRTLSVAIKLLFRPSNYQGVISNRKIQ